MLLREVRCLPFAVIIKAFSFVHGRSSMIAILAWHCSEKSIIADQMTDLQLIKYFIKQLGSFKPKG